MRTIIIFLMISELFEVLFDLRESAECRPSATPPLVLAHISEQSRITTEEQHYANLLAEIREQTEPLLNMDQPIIYRIDREN